MRSKDVSLDTSVITGQFYFYRWSRTY